MQTSVLLSIKPEFAERIFLGAKRYEFRRKLFRRPGITKVILYVSAPVGKVLGEFEIEDILELDKEVLWDRTKDYAGISKDYFDSYFEDRAIGFAIKIGETKLYDAPLQLAADFNIKSAPQSFAYITS